MSPQSIALTTTEGQIRADSRMVAQGFGIQHESLIRTLATHPEASSDLKSEPRAYRTESGQAAHYWLLTEDSVMMLPAICKPSPELTAFQLRLVKAFREMRDKLAAKGVSPNHTLPQDYPSALRALADEHEARQRLTAQVEADAPKVAYASAVQVAGQTWPFRKVCKLLKPKPLEADFKAWLIRHRWLTSTGDATSERLRSGDMVLIETEREHNGVPYRDADGKGRMDVTPHWTGPGKVKVIAAWARRGDVEVAP